MSNFTDAVEHNCEGIETVAVGCRGIKCEYAEGDPNHACEASFSWHSCDSCGSGLGGDRLPASGLIRDKSGELELIEMSICVDCAMYHANGEEPEEGRP